jgi:hypothetical protein
MIDASIPRFNEYFLIFHSRVHCSTKWQLLMRMFSKRERKHSTEGDQLRRLHMPHIRLEFLSLNLIHLHQCSYTLVTNSTVPINESDFTIRIINDDYLFVIKEFLFESKC